MKDLIIIGAGPRGIGLALQAIERDLSVLIVDPEPLSTWRNIPMDINMRSPIGFDLVSFMPQYSQYSLSKYLGGYIEFKDQQDIERQVGAITRAQFLNYMEFMWSRVLSICEYKRDRVIDIGPNRVSTTTDSYRGKNIVIAYSPFKEIGPRWLNSSFKAKFIDSKDIDSINNARVWVIGSGQSAAEFTYALCKGGNTVNWFIKKQPKVEQYPVPTYNQWGYKTALGDYYRSISSNKNAAMKYLKEVKSWQPSITPYIKGLLDSVSNRYRTILEQPSLIGTYEDLDYLLLCGGISPSVDLVPLSISIEREINNSNYPLLNKGFRTKEGYIFTGLLASLYDGPRQGSLISIGKTSEEILDNLV